MRTNITQVCWLTQCSLYWETLQNCDYIGCWLTNNWCLVVTWLIIQVDCGVWLVVNIDVSLMMDQHEKTLNEASEQRKWATRLSRNLSPERNTWPFVQLRKLCFNWTPSLNFAVTRETLLEHHFLGVLQTILLSKIVQYQKRKLTVSWPDKTTSCYPLWTMDTLSVTTRWQNILYYPLVVIH